VLELVNDTAWHHPIHLHGHAFRAEIAFVADNPGDWMLHCHVLEHQATGMMAVVRVA
jgi:FtsP/CotA-like multicopper oxidase with cupredoxin domain